MNDKVNELVEHIVIKLKNSKYKFASLDDISKSLKKKLGDEFTGEISIRVRQGLIDHPEIDFFREETYVHDFRFYFSAGNWIACKGYYKNPIEAKFTMGIKSWQASKYDDEKVDIC